MAKISVLTKDFDDSLLNRTDPIVYLPKVAAPFTTVVKRALMTDLANDLLPRFGVDRVMTQTIQEIQGESGPAGERVFKPINDQHDAVRIVGGIGLLNNSSGQQIFLDPSGFVEISFYGTGLNLLHFTDTNARSLTVTTDGVLGATITLSSSTNSIVLAGRNYSMSCVSNIVSGLALGFHTVKLIVVNQIIFSGYEVINTSSNLQLLPGRSYLGGKRLYKAAASTDAYNSNFESGTLGTKGGHVVVYQKSDGTVAKAVTPTNASQANLGSTNHTNESVIRTINYREFGAGRSDDFSSASGTVAPRAFTLDDGTTTLVHNNAAGSFINGVDVLQLPGNTNFLTLTFVGTGLDIIETDSAAGGSDSYTVSIDGATGLSMATAGLTTVRVVKICSGLPYGTHTVKVTRVTAATFALCVKEFIIYGPSKPSLPSGAIELADYYLMADYIANTTAGLDTIPTGVIRKSNVREMLYANGTGGSTDWTIGGPTPSSYASGFETFSDRLNAFFEYTFLGFGFEFRFASTASRSSNISVTLNGLAATVVNFPSLVSSVYGTGVTFSAGVLDQNDASTTVGAGFRLSGLPFGKYTVRFNNNSASSYLHTNLIDIITPVHSPKINQPGDLQNTLPIGSCAIGDSRKFSSTSVKTLANWAQARGITSAATTTSTSFVPVPDMSVSIKTSGNPVQVSYNVASTINAAGQTVDFIVYIDGVSLASSRTQLMPSLSGYRQTATCAVIVPLAEGFHKIDVYWVVSGNTATAVDVTRQISVMEI